jgi:hypothetical protein
MLDLQCHGRVFYLLGFTQAANEGADSIEKFNGGVLVAEASNIGLPEGCFLLVHVIVV